MTNRTSLPIRAMTVPLLTAQVDRMQHQLDEKDAEIRRLRGALAVALLPYRGHTVVELDGVPTIILGSGEIYQMVTTDSFTETETVLGKREFRKIGSVPTSPAARIADLLSVTAASIPTEGMSCDEEALERAS
jgi:hypothetical protein